MKLNSTGKSNASSHISSGNYDATSSWSFSAEDGNKLLGPNGDDWANYSKWHLGQDTAQPDDTKAHYGYPFGKNGKVYRSGLVAIRQRASQQNANDIFDAAGSLIDMIDKKEGNSNDVHFGGSVVRFSKPSNERAPGYRVQASAGGKSAEIFLYDIIGEGWMGGISAQNFAKDIRALGAVRTIDVRINSDGGDVFDGKTMYSLLSQHPANINVYVDGLAASIASLIAMAGDKIIMAKGAMMMIHNAWGVVVGNAGEMRKQAAILETVDQTLVGTYCDRSGITPAKCTQMMADETWMDAEECLKNGFCDEIAEPMKVAAKVHDLVAKKDGRVVPVSARFHHIPSALRPNRIAAALENDRLRELIKKRV